MTDEPHAGVSEIDTLMGDLQRDGEVVVHQGLVAWRVALTAEPPYAKAGWFWAHEPIAELHPVEWDVDHENVEWRLVPHYVGRKLIEDILEGKLDRVAA